MGTIKINMDTVLNKHNTKSANVCAKWLRYGKQFTIVMIRNTRSFERFYF